ncbi:hypothetical protein QLS97_16870 [Flavobacterium sp. LB2P87]|uniref:Cell wall protein CWP1 n=1 Tax=Flavobacterium yafengii TaxID=3041253 RepID=A0AAW6TV55_9FLAO|nr:hypothetical protein [Flavobacterium yafengii]MDI5951320.1 hypothetical protein [Flavobacterium yafengii]
MKFSTRFFISLSSLANVIIAASEEFTLKLQADGTALAGDNIHISSDNKFFISDTDQTATGQIEDDGTLKINGYTVGVGKNYLSLTADSSSFMTAEPWSIVGGQLKLYGSNFHAVPSGQSGIYVLGTINAASGRSDVINVAIEAQGSNGKSVSDYDASTKSSSVQSSSSSSSTEASSTPVSSAEQTTTSTSSSIVESTNKKETSSTVASSAKTSVFSSEPEPSSEGTTSAVPESSSQLPASSSTQEEVPKSSTAAASSSTEISSSTVIGSISSAIESTSSAVGSTGSPAITSSSASIARSATLLTVSSSNLSSSAVSIQTFDNAGMKNGASVFAAVVAGIALF